MRRPNGTLMDIRNRLRRGSWASVRAALLPLLVVTLSVGTAVAQQCSGLIAQDTLAALDNGGDVAFCADLDYRTALRSERSLDGVRLTAFAQGCDYDSLVFYPYFTFPYQGARGPYVLEEWTVNGRILRDTFANVNALVAQMNAFDPGGNWFNDAVTKNIVGGVKGARYGTMRVLHIGDQIRRTVAVNYQAIANGTQVTARGPGFHTYTIFDPRTNCRDTLTLFIKPVLPLRRDTVYTKAQTLSRQFCVDNGGLVGRPQTATICSGTPRGRVTEVSAYCFTYAPAAGFSGSEDICIEVCDDTRQLGGPVCQRTIVTVVTGTTRRVTTDTVRVTIEPRDTLVCLDAVLQIGRPIVSAQMCSAQPDGVSVEPLRSGCVNLRPAADFAGVAEACVVHCAQGVCDTTRLIVTVRQPCDVELFRTERDSVADSGNPTAYCIAVPPARLADYALSIDGRPYTGPRVGCDVQSRVIYSYAALYEEGREGPYTLVDWSVDGQSFDTNFASMADLVAFMNQSDPQGDWRLEAGNVQIVGGRPAGNYGALVILHDATGTRSELVANPVDLPMGTRIDLPGRGTYVITATGLADGCRDALTVKVGADLPNGVKRTIVVAVDYETTSPRTCAFEALRDDVRSCGSPARGTASVDAGACVTYQPGLGFVGRDTMCLLTCSLPGGAPCDTTIIVFEVTRRALVTDTVRVQSFGESPVLACGSVPFGGPYEAPKFCGTQGAFSASAAGGTCVEIRAQTGATQAGQVCVEWCAVSDPAYCQRVVFIVTPTVACSSDVLAQDSLLLPPSAGAASVCLGDGVDLSAYVISVDGRVVTPESSPSCGTSVTTGGGGGSKTVLSYTTVFLEEANPIRIEGWDIGGALVSGVEAQGLRALADSMSAYDPNATWTYDADAAALVSDVEEGNYSPMIVFDLATGSVQQLPLETTTTTEPGGTRFVPGAVVSIPTAGRYMVTVVNEDAGCGEQQLIYRQPQSRPRRDTVRQEVNADQINGPYCLDVIELSGPATSIALCGGPSQGAVGFSSSGCYTYTPHRGASGADEVCVVICAQGGLECDTTVVLLNITSTPTASPTRDTVLHTVVSGATSQFFCLSEAQLPGAADRQVSCGSPANGTLDFASSLCYTYTPAAGFVGTDEACVVLCSGAVCDTTVLRFTVSARPPSSGTRRDTLRVAVTSDTLSEVFCLSTRELPGAPTDLLSCGLPRSGNITFVGDSCFTYLPDAGFVGRDTACVLLCSGAVCDSSIIYFTVVRAPVTIRPVRDTVRQLVRANRLNGPYCVDVAQLPGAPTSSSTCGPARHGALLKTSEACYTYRPTAGYVGQDTACLIVCSGAVCDTTVLVFTVGASPSCEDFTPTTPLDFALSNCDSTARFEFTTAVTDLGTVRLTLDGVPVAGVRSGSLISLELPVGSYRIAARDTVRDCSSEFAVTVSCDADCQLPFGTTTLTRFVACDTGSVSVCLPTTVGALDGFTITVDGEPYAGPVGECGSAERIVYDVADAGAGPFGVDSFRIGQTFFAATVADLDALADSLTLWDAGARWSYDAAAGTIAGGDPDRDYGVLRITELSTLRAQRISAGRETVAAGVALRLTLGAPVRNLRFSSQAGTCQQDIALTLQCVDSEVDAVSVEVDADLLYCVAASELNGAIVTLTNACPAPDSIAGVDFDAVVGCVTLRGVRPGTRRLCLVACDALGVCDTTFLDVTVTRPAPVGPVLAEADRFRIVRNTDLSSSLTANDTFEGPLDTIRIISPPSRGTATVGQDGILSYRPDADACDFTDTLLYEICRGTTCDQATVSIRVRCGAVEVYRGFSPNGDGINDAFRIEGIEDFPESVVTVYNRWGNLVFTATGYRNDWMGTWADRTLTSGTYFYLVELPGEEPLTGWVELAR